MSFCVAGRADDPGYAEAERLCDELYAFVECTVVKFRKSPSEWPAFASQLAEVLGAPAVESPFVWTACGRIIGDLAAFSKFVYRRYGLRCDLPLKQLEVHAQINLAESRIDTERHKVALQQSGKRALVVVDVQNDFCKGGALAVPKGNDVIPLINTLLSKAKWDFVVYTQDFHPKGHASFASSHRGAKPFETRHLPGIGEQVMWPDHCVQGSIGAEFHPYLNTRVPYPTSIVQKGKLAKVDSYSGFGDGVGHTLENTGLDVLLRENEINDVFVCGLALDFCVAYTAKDAKLAGFNTFLVSDASKPITQAAGAAAIESLAKQGVHIVITDTVPTKAGPP